MSGGLCRGGFGFRVGVGFVFRSLRGTIWCCENCDSVLFWHPEYPIKVILSQSTQDLRQVAAELPHDVRFNHEPRKRGTLALGFYLGAFRIYRVWGPFWGFYWGFEGIFFFF